jgi:predicted membrane metal-binding protein
MSQGIVCSDVPNLPNTHESYTARTDVKSGSDRSFGLVFAVVFCIVALFPLLDSGDVRIWALIVASIFVLAAFFCTAALKPLNLTWFKFGLLLHKIVNPIIMGLMFYLTIMPIGLIMRLAGKDILNLRIDKAAPTYWITRESPERDSLKNQF